MKTNELDELNKRVANALGQETKHWDSKFTIPDYTRDIGAAWELVEIMDNHGIWKLSNGDGDSRDFDFFPCLHESIHAQCETSPEAITQAFLSWWESRGEPND